MPSAALATWSAARARRLDQLRAAHATIGGSGPGRRWQTEELNHALILRLASEFQGFARDLHGDLTDFVTTTLALGNPAIEDALRAAHTRNLRLDRGNAEPGALSDDFGVFGFALWDAIYARYPARGPAWNKKLGLLNTARNGIAHDDQQKIAKVIAEGWPLNLASVTRWRSALNELASAMDAVTASRTTLVYGHAPWP